MLQETMDCRGLWEWRAESEGRVSLLAEGFPAISPGRLLARTQAGRTTGGRKNVQAPLRRSPRLGLQPCGHPGTG